MEQHILFRGYSPHRVSRAMPLWKFLKLFAYSSYCFIKLSWNFINGYTMMWRGAYCFEVTVHQTFTELCPFENFRKLLCFLLTPPTVYIRSSWTLSFFVRSWTLSFLLDHGVEQRILFRGYRTPNISSCAPLKISVKYPFPAYPSYSLHPIKLKLCK